MKNLKTAFVFLVLLLGINTTAMAAGTCPITAGIPKVWFLTPLSAILALIIAFIFYKKVMAEDEGNEKMVEIAGHVREGAHAYLFSQYKIVAFVFLLFFGVP